MKKTNVLLSAFFFALFIFQGCAVLDHFGFNKKPERKMYNTAEQLIREGAVAFADEDYEDALEAYTQLKDWYPFSRYAILAELRIADSHYELEEYDEAIFAYTDFEELHPKNDAIPRIIYRRGLCWYERMDTTDRDSKPAARAIIQFNRLKERFPDSTYVSKINEMIVECTDNMAGHEFYVAEFYYKSKNYKASLNRYKYLVEHFPASEYAVTALNRIGKVQEKVDKIEKKASKL